MKIDNTVLVIGVLAIAGVAFVLGGGAGPASAGAPVAQPVGISSPDGIICNLAGNPSTLSWVVKDKLNMGTEVGADIGYWSGEDFVGRQAAAFTVNPGEAYKAYAYDNATYYGSYVTGTLPCSTNPALSLTQYLVGTANFKSVKNSDGSTLNAIASPEGIGTGQTAALGFTVEANVTDAYASNPEVDKYVISVMGNGSTSCMDASKYSVSGCDSIDVPSQLAGTYVKSFECSGALNDWANAQHTLVVGAKAACNPNENLTIRYDDMTYFVDGDDGLVKMDTATENDVDVGAAAQTRVIYTN